MCISVSWLAQPIVRFALVNQVAMNMLRLDPKITVLLSGVQVRYTGHRCMPSEATPFALAGSDGFWGCLAPGGLAHTEVALPLSP